MAKTTEELKGCIYRNTCVENKYLCCHFCKDKKCEDRCLDNIDTCKYRCELPPPPEEKEDKDKNVDAKKLKEV
jgi:hypothetical protein